MLLAWNEFRHIRHFCVKVVGGKSPSLTYTTFPEISPDIIVTRFVSLCSPKKVLFLISGIYLMQYKYEKFDTRLQILFKSFDLEALINLRSKEVSVAVHTIFRCALTIKDCNLSQWVEVLILVPVLVFSVFHVVKISEYTRTTTPHLHCLPFLFIFLFKQNEYN